MFLLIKLALWGQEVYQNISNKFIEYSSSEKFSPSYHVFDDAFTLFRDRGPGNGPTSRGLSGSGSRAHRARGGPGLLSQKAPSTSASRFIHIYRQAGCQVLTPDEGALGCDLRPEKLPCECLSKCILSQPGQSLSRWSFNGLPANQNHRDWGPGFSF